MPRRNSCRRRYESHQWSNDDDYDGQLLPAIPAVFALAKGAAAKVALSGGAKAAIAGQAKKGIFSKLSNVASYIRGSGGGSEKKNKKEKKKKKKKKGLLGLGIGPLYYDANVSNVVNQYHALTSEREAVDQALNYSMQYYAAVPGSEIDIDAPLTPGELLKRLDAVDTRLLQLERILREMIDKV